MTNVTRLLVGLASGTALGTLTLAIRKWQRDNAPLALPAAGGTANTIPRQEEAEPILGYDGMDAGTLIDWLERAELDAATLERIRRYEVRHRDRQDVLQVIDDLMD